MLTNVGLRAFNLIVVTRIGIGSHDELEHFPEEEAHLQDNDMSHFTREQERQGA